MKIQINAKNKGDIKRAMEAFDSASRDAAEVKRAIEEWSGWVGTGMRPGVECHVRDCGSISFLADEQYMEAHLAIMKMLLGRYQDKIYTVEVELEG